MRLQIMTVELNTKLPLTRQERREITDQVRACLLRGFAVGEIGFPETDERGQELVSLIPHAPLLETPTNGADAYRLGAWRRMNPFEKGTSEHAEWNKDWDHSRRLPF